MLITLSTEKLGYGLTRRAIVHLFFLSFFACDLNVDMGEINSLFAGVILHTADFISHQ